MVIFYSYVNVFTRGYGNLGGDLGDGRLDALAAQVWGDSDTESGSEPSRTEAWKGLPAAGDTNLVGFAKITRNGIYHNGTKNQVTPIVIDWYYNLVGIQLSQIGMGQQKSCASHLQCIPCETPSPRERLGRCSVLTRQLALSVIEPLGISRPCGDKKNALSEIWRPGSDPTFRPFKCFAGKE